MYGLAVRCKRREIEHIRDPYSRFTEAVRCGKFSLRVGTDYAMVSKRPARGSDDVKSDLPGSDSEAQPPQLRLSFEALTLIAAFGSLVTCYGNIIALNFFGTRLVPWNAHVQAVFMWSLALLAVYGLWRSREQHQQVFPLAVGAAGVAVLIFTLYVKWDTRFEILAYTLLVLAALLNQSAILSRLYRTVRQQALQIRDFNRNLEDEVRRQVREIERLGRLKGFLAPQVAEMVMGEGKEGLLDSHRRDIACLFCDIRGFTSFSERVEPEEAISLLQVYHERVGGLVAHRRGTIGLRAGDGVMVFFNDPIPCEEPVKEAVMLALEIQGAVQDVREHWQRLGHSIGVGIGIASGYATLGLLGSQGRADYTAIGNVVNIAARLCGEAKDREILITQRAYLDIEPQIEGKLCDPLQLKGVSQPVETYSVVGLRSSLSSLVTVDEDARGF